jgi:hypothetical protein
VARLHRASLNPLGGLDLGPDAVVWLPAPLIVAIIAVVMRDEVTKTLNLFLGYATFKDRLGGNPRRGILLAPGPPPACSPAGRPRRSRWPIRARPGRFTPEVS